MAKTDGFLEYTRKDAPKRQVSERIKDYKEIEGFLSVSDVEIQAARCMDCGVPFCHSFGCPIKNLIPDWNDMIFHKQWKKAYELLNSSNGLPEITGRICPAPCEYSCTLAINQPAVTIRQIELQIIENAWKEGWTQSQSQSYKSGKKVAVIGSGPAGLSAAQVLNELGHQVVVFEKSNRIGGLLRYGIPDFKLEKWIIDRRLDLMKREGIIFEPGVEAGIDISDRYVKQHFDAILISTGAGVPRDLKVPGRELNNIHFAMEFLTQQNQINAGDIIPPEKKISAKGKNVVVIGGGDTGSDCIGTSIRQGAKKITQIELLPQPPENRNPDNPWPTWPLILRSSTSHEEGCERIWSVLTKEFVGKNGKVTKLKCVKILWFKDENGKMIFREIPSSEFEIDADIVFLAMGFHHVEHGPLIKNLNLSLDNNGNIKVDENYMTSSNGVFAAGDSMTGASLVVRAIYYARQAAFAINNFFN